MAQVIPTLAALRTQREAILRVAARHGASNIRVFGSVARSDATEMSDIDLLVDQDWTRLSGWGGMELVIKFSESRISSPPLNPLLRGRFFYFPDLFPCKKHTVRIIEP